MLSFLQTNTGFLVAATACEIALMGAAFFLTSGEEDYYEKEEEVVVKPKRKTSKSKHKKASKPMVQEATNIVRLFN
jgi:hypothetical protein